MGYRNNRTCAWDFHSIRRRMCAWEDRGGRVLRLGHPGWWGCMTRSRAKVCLAVCFCWRLALDSRMRDIFFFTFSNTSTSNLPRGSFLSMYATTNPAMPVPMTATFLRSFTSMVKEGKVDLQFQERKSVYGHFPLLREKVKVWEIHLNQKLTIGDVSTFQPWALRQS